MTAGRARFWLPALMLGYALFSGILFCETAYVLPRMYQHDSANFPAEMFRAEWFRAALRYAPVRWLAMGPCQRWPQLSTALLVTAVCLLALGYLGALRAVSRRPAEWPLRRLLGVAALAALPLTLLLPPTSGDYAVYLLMGRMISVYHASPWTHVLTQFPAEQRYLSPWAWGANLPCVYGPVWAAIVALTTGIGHALMPGEMTFAGLMLNVLLLRGAHFLALAAAGAAIWRLNGRCWPAQQRLVAAAFLLNPFLVYEAIGALHNDLWGVALLLWACALFLEEDNRYLLPLALSVLAKFVSLAVVPFLGVYYWRRRDGRRLGWLLITVLVCLTVTQWTAALGIKAYLAASRGQFLLSPTCFPQFIAMVITLLRGLPSLRSGLVGTVARVMTGIFVPVFLALLGRTHTREQVIRHTLLVLLFYFALVYSPAMPWYLLWPLGLLGAIRWSRTTANAAWASSLILLGYGMQFWNHSGIHGWGAWTLVPGFLAAIGLPLLVSVAGCAGWWDAVAASGAASAAPDDEGRRRGPADGGSAPARAGIARPEGPTPVAPPVSR